MKQKKLLCARHPLLYFISVWEKRIRRYLRWIFGKDRYCNHKSFELLPIRLKRHQSLLFRKLGDSDPQLQVNKVQNLKLAIKNIDMLVLKPGETFSFWKTVGLPTRNKGYLEGILLSRGEVRNGTGGGLCQLSNLIYWMALHTPLSVTERSHHGFDPFPDDNRTLPFGSGATVFYNYVDLQFTNKTAYTFQLRIWLTEKHLKGEIRCDSHVPVSYKIFEDDHAFLFQEDKYYRKNKIWRHRVDRKTGNIVNRELVASNFVEVKYTPPEYLRDCITNENPA